jgi:pimeloyl-ACP methyl ester carboxylesterase
MAALFRQARGPGRGPKFRHASPLDCGRRRVVAGAGEDVSRIAFLSIVLLAGLAPGPVSAQGQAEAPPPRIEWRDCPWTQAAPAEARCGHLVAPLSRTAGGGANVRVFFAIYRATGAEPPLPDPVVVVPGGPGALFNPPVAYVMQGLAELRRRREIVIIDQRGVGRSLPRLACEAEPADDGAAPRRHGALDCLAKLKARGVDPAAFNTDETAHDLRDLRLALRLEAWNAMGASYGSRVVLRLMQIDPEGTRAAVTVASLPLAPSLARADNAQFRRALIARLFADCAADPACAAAYGDLAAKFARIEEMLKPGAARPSPEAQDVYTHLLEVERRTGGIAAALIRQLDWSEELPKLPRAVADLHDFLAGTKLLSRTRIDAIYGLAMPRRLPPIDHTLIFSTTRCPEDVLPETGGAERGGRRSGTCAAFESGPVPDTPPEKTPPLLILTGAYDIRTLTGWSDDIARRVPGAILARFGDYGHDVSYRHPCGNALMNAFIADPKTKLDLACVEQHRRPRFEAPETVH